MRIIIVILIILSLFVIGCKRHHNHSWQDDLDISVDPWTPPYDLNGHHSGNGEQPVPEPSTLVLVGGGLVAIYFKRRRKK